MPARVLRFELSSADGRDVEAEFLNLYGGTEEGWEWLVDQLESIDPTKLKERCERRAACDYLKLWRYWVFGRLLIRDEEAWWDGLHEGRFVIEAVVHDDHASEYYEERLAQVPISDQDL